MTGGKVENMKTIKSKNITKNCYGIYNNIKNSLGCIFDTEKEAKEILERFSSTSSNYEIVIVMPQV